MTARPMTEGEREEALELARWISDKPDAHAGIISERGVSLLARALLSTSAAVRGMREALECIAAAYQDQDITHRAFRTIAGVAAVEALSGIEGEDEQARPSGSAPISTDTKGTTK